MLEVRHKRLFIQVSTLSKTNPWKQTSESGFLWEILTGKWQKGAFSDGERFLYLDLEVITQWKIHWTEHLGFVHFAVSMLLYCSFENEGRKEKESRGRKGERKSRREGRSEEEREREVYTLLWCEDMISRI